VAALALDLDEYAKGRTLQPFTAFRTGVIGGARRDTDFGRIVSYGIRRCEFDHYLLERSGAQVLTGVQVRTLRRDGGTWIVDDHVRARVVVGAGGHFCPIARFMNPDTPQAGVIVAQEIEFPLAPAQADRCTVLHDRPDLYFWPDLRGYGWCVRKGGYLNVGVGRLSSGNFPAVVREFADLVDKAGIVPGGVPSPWKGHAYFVNSTSHRRTTGDNMMLIGDAAGLALAPSGEGILTAIESGLAAGRTIARGESFADYERWIDTYVGPRGRQSPLAKMPGWVLTTAARAVFGSAWLTRRFLIEDAFLHTRRPAPPL
jgi:flavin-dependent dehydrogenase